MLMAFGAVLLPVSWMAAIHEWLGFGEYPAVPLTDYLNRSVSMLYGIHGGLMVLLSTNVRRYATIIRYVMWMHLALGAVMIVVDLRAPMPWWWTLSEGPTIVPFALVMLYMLRSVPAER